VKKVDVIFGTRPEAIKLLPLILALSDRPAEFSVRSIVSAQHREMLDQVINAFDIQIDIDLDIMQPQQSLSDVTAACIQRLEPVLRNHGTDLVLVQGDTSTAFSAALAAFYSRIPVGHVEAGLRSFDALNPYPEEMNRRLCDNISRWHFAPTDTARNNLLNEGVDADGVFVTGNTGIDALHISIDRIESDSNATVSAATIAAAAQPFILVTAHRRENLGQPLQNLCKALRNIADRHPEFRIVFPMHPNPLVRQTVEPGLSHVPNIELLEPLEYFDFVYLQQKCFFVVTDSGGIQEEAPSLGKPVLVVRSNTERPEAVAVGTVELVGSDAKRIESAMEALLTDKSKYAANARAINPYGDGHAAKRIVDALRYIYGFNDERPLPFDANTAGDVPSAIR